MSGGGTFCDVVAHLCIFPCYDTLEKCIAFILISVRM